MYRMGSVIGKTIRKRHSKKHNRTMRKGGGKGTKLPKNIIKTIIDYEEIMLYKKELPEEKIKEKLEDMKTELKEMRFEVPDGKDKSSWLRKNINSYTIARGEQKK